MLAFHRVYGAHRLRARPQGTLDRPRLLDGAARLLGSWFPDAIGDPARRAHGVHEARPDLERWGRDLRSCNPLTW